MDNNEKQTQPRKGLAAPTCSSIARRLRGKNTNYSDIREYRETIIEECAVAIETQIKGTRYEWESDSHFATMTKEIAQRVRKLKMNVQREPAKKKS